MFNLRGVRQKLVHPHRHQSEPLVDIVVQLSRDTGALFLLRLNQLSSHIRECLLHLYALGDVLRKKENPTWLLVKTPPGTNLPADPLRSVWSIPAVFVVSQGLSGDTTAMRLFPPLGKGRGNIIVASPYYLSTVKVIV